MKKRELMESVAKEVAGGKLCKAVMEAFDVCFESDSRGGKDYEAMRRMAIHLLAEANAINVMHWNVETNAQHELLSEAYELCRDTGDKLAETYMSITEKPCVPRGRHDFDAPEYDAKDALESLRRLHKEMQDTVDANPKFSEGVKNVFADFDEAMTTIIYKYQQFNA